VSGLPEWRSHRNSVIQFLESEGDPDTLLSEPRHEPLLSESTAQVDSLV
jgi:hypothetical protein